MILSMVVMTTMLGLAGFAGEFQFSFQRHAMESLSLAAQAVALREKSVQEEAESVTQQEAATKDFAVAETDEASSQQWQSASARDREVAAAELARASEFQAQAVFEEETASAHAAAATAAQDVALESMEAAGTDEITAARWEAAAAEDGWTVTVCQMIPLLDVACDVIGGTTLLLAEAAGTESTAKAAVEWTAAVTATREREREETLAAEYEQQAMHQQKQAMLTKEKANAAKIKAEEEAAEAEAFEMQSQEAKEKAAVEEARAQELISAAVMEESTSFELGQQSIVVGVHACWDGIVTIIMATGALVLGAVTFINSTCRTISSVCSASPSSKTTTTRPEYRQQTRPFLPALLRSISFVWHHVGLFVISINLRLIVKPWMQGFSDLDCLHRGEAILRFALVAAVLQTNTLHTIPYMIQTWFHHSKLVWCIDVFLHVAVYTFLWSSWLVLEFLILWAVWGPSILSYLLFSTNHLDWCLSLIALGLGITVMLHLCFLETCVPSPHGNNRMTNENQPAQMSDEDPKEKSEWESINETSLLLPSHRSEASSRHKYFSVRSVLVHQLQSLVGALKLLQYPLKLLVCTCMISVLQKCTNMMDKVWPFSKSLLLTHAPRWVRPAAIVLLTLGLLTFFVMIGRGFWKCCKRQHLSKKSEALNVS
jgi:chemotaxis protein histidine kinase CheA